MGYSVHLKPESDSLEVKDSVSDGISDVVPIPPRMRALRQCDAVPSVTYFQMELFGGNVERNGPPYCEMQTF